jgi:hypothetical protein
MDDLDLILLDESANGLYFSGRKNPRHFFAVYVANAKPSL